MNFSRSKKSPYQDYKLLTFFLAVLFLECVSSFSLNHAHAMEDRKAIKAEDTYSVAKAESEKTCDANVKIVIGDITFNVPITRSLVYNDIDGTEHRYNYSGLGPSHPFNDCDTKNIQNIQSVQIGATLYYCNTTPNSCETTYARLEKIFKDAEKSGNITTLANGTLKTTNRPELYLLSQDLSPTGNGEPVMFECSGQEKDSKKFIADICSTRYIHPDGLALGYQFFRQRHSEDTYSAVDQNFRKHYDDMKVD